MTGREFQISFEQQAKYVDELNDLTILSEDVNYYLVEAERNFVVSRTKNLGPGMKDSKRERDELSTIMVKNAQLTIDPVLTTNEYRVYTFPSDYFYLLADKSVTEFCNTQRTFRNRLTVTEDLQEVLDNFHSQSDYRSPVSELIDDKLYVYRDQNLTFDIISVNIDYLRVWVPIDVLNNVGSELPESVHGDIVRDAVRNLQQAVREGTHRGTLENELVDGVQER